MDTIVALATAPMNCAIHIIRISGSNAFDIVNKVINKDLKRETFKIQRRYIVDNNQVIDDVLISTFIGPKTFSGEDIVEINCHGGIVVANLIIRLLIKNGCRIAERGEFSRRALLNKKMDLTAVEAINNLVNASNELSAKGTVNALLGNVSQSIKDFQHQLFMIIGQIEVNIDYPEYDDVEQVDAIILKEKLETLNNQVDELLQRSKRFIPINKGIKVLIIGKPNAGKSTLLNALANEDKAIVSDIPGTTRDAIETIINVDNLTLNIIDTAGIHQTNDVIENLGINKAKALINQVDLVLYLIAPNEVIDDELFNLVKNQNHLVVYTKKDLIDNSKLDDKNIYVNAKDKEINSLINKIKEIFSVLEFEKTNLDLLQSQRQIGIVENVKLLIQRSLDNINNNDPLDLIVADLEIAHLKLNELLGISSNYDFLDDLFKHFCVGK